MRKLALTLVPLVLLACGREPAAPDVAPAPMFAATSDWTLGSAAFDIDSFIPCRGSNIHFSQELQYRQHQVFTTLDWDTWIRRGVYNYNIQFVPGPGHAVEQATGIVFLYQQGGPSNQSGHIAVAAGATETWMDRGVWVAPNGDELIVSTTWHITYNGNMEVVVARGEPIVEVQCVFEETP